MTWHGILGALAASITCKCIYETVWGDHYVYEYSTIMVHISSLREKNERDTPEKIILDPLEGSHCL
ncbi:winged helix-turn-helix domain-containing protein [Paenibacillus terreus]|uniref:Winged helix-turn-helix domain-containing protein n=1 Tax=Paenibacillus terreus TaxID=1387834 RepID=A0ABV5BAN6_9BACL